MKQRVLAIAALIAFLVFVATSPVLFKDILNGWLAAFEAFAGERPVVAAGAFIGLAAASVLLGPFSSAPTAPFAVAAWGEVFTLIMLLAGWLAGGIAAYVLGLWIGEPLVARIAGRRQMDAWLKKVASHLDFLTLLLFRLAMPAETGYFFGFLRYRFDLYLVITLLAELPFALVIIYGSAALISASAGSIALAALAWIAVVALALRLFARRVRK